MSVKSEWDVVIAGAGFVGLALGAALSGAGFRVLLVDPRAGEAWRDPRASTLVQGVENLLRAIAAWEEIAPEAEPVVAMEITDSRLENVLRPVFLTFGEEVEGRPFAHVAPNGAIHAALLGAARRAGAELLAGRVHRVAEQPGRVRIELEDGSDVAARLLVAADGAASPVRALAGIRRLGWRYDQASIVTNVRHDLPHGGRAVQHFLEAGPFALLPLKGDRSSVVWSERPLEAERICALDDRAFLAELERRSGGVFGAMELDGPRAFRRLALGIAERFHAGRVALVGDAAHSMHPLAGQGLNFGLKDVAALAEALVDSARLGGDFGAPDVLDAYDRARRLDTMAMLGATDGLKRLFDWNAAPVRLVRDAGLGAVERITPLKQALARQAAGLSPRAPRLVRGEAL